MAIGDSLDYGRVIPDVSTGRTRRQTASNMGVLGGFGSGLGPLLGGVLPVAAASALSTAAPRSAKEGIAAGVGSFLASATPIGALAGGLGALGIARGIWGSSKQPGDKDATAVNFDPTMVEEFRMSEGGADLRGLRYNDVKKKYYNANGDEFNNEHETYLLNSLGRFNEFSAMRAKTKEQYLKFKDLQANKPGRAGTIIVPMDNKTAGAVIGSSVPSTGTVIG